jgi:putative oxidoreductase
MTRLLSLYVTAFDLLDRAAGRWFLPSLARLVFAGVLLVYFWASAMTKLGDGPLGFLFLSSGAYAQMFPKVFEAVSYDASAIGLGYKLVALFGTWAEFILPLMIVIGLLTRFAAIGMIGFIIVQSVTDIIGHNADAATIGAWFDRASGSLIVDQRSLWIFVLLVLVVRGAGPASVDAVVLRQRGSA